MFAQSVPYSIIYGHCLNADVQAALKLVGEAKQSSLTGSDANFVANFELRFGGEVDRSNFLFSRDESLIELLTYYRDYWRASLLNPLANFDSSLAVNVSKLLGSAFRINHRTGQSLPTDTLNRYLKSYIGQKGFHTAGYGRTGKLLDLLVWKSESDSVFEFSVDDETLRAPVVFLSNFITLGWEEYATLDRYYPGGWTTRDALYCVQKAYKIGTENFLVNYLCHEARHFADYKLFPKLSSADLEYRAKLTELSKLEKNLYPTLSQFISQSDSKSSSAHPLANYYVIRDVSRLLFNKDFETELSAWRRIPVAEIHAASERALRHNTKQLLGQGKDVEQYINTSLNK